MPTANPATTPEGSATPSAMLANAPASSTDRPIRRQRPGHVRRGRHHDGRRDREPHRGIARRRVRGGDPAQAVGARAPPRTPTPPPRTGRSGRRRGARRRASACACGRRSGSAISTTAQTNSTSYAVSQNHPNRPGQRGEELLRRPVELPRSGRDDRDQADHDQARARRARRRSAAVLEARRSPRRRRGRRRRGATRGTDGRASRNGRPGPRGSPAARWRSSIDPSLDAQSARSGGGPRDPSIAAADGMMGRTQRRPAPRREEPRWADAARCRGRCGASSRASREPPRWRSSTA